jgi:hypothetical protein
MTPGGVASAVAKAYVGGAFRFSRFSTSKARRFAYIGQKRFAVRGVSEGSSLCQPWRATQSKGWSLRLTLTSSPGLRSIRHSVSFLLVNSEAGPRSDRSDKEAADTRPRVAVAWAAGTIASIATYFPVSHH